MRKRVNIGYPLDGKRMLSVKEGETYSGMGRDRFRAFAEKAGAVRKYGRRVLIDKAVLDKALDQMAAVSD